MVGIRNFRLKMMACISIARISCKFYGQNASMMGLPLHVPAGGDSLILGISSGGGSRAGLRGGEESSRIGGLSMGRFFLRLSTSFQLTGDWMVSLRYD